MIKTAFLLLAIWPVDGGYTAQTGLYETREQCQIELADLQDRHRDEYFFVDCIHVALTYE